MYVYDHTTVVMLLQSCVISGQLCTSFLISAFESSTKPQHFTRFTPFNDSVRGRFFPELISPYRRKPFYSGIPSCSTVWCDADWFEFDDSTVCCGLVRCGTARCDRLCGRAARRGADVCCFRILWWDAVWLRPNKKLYRTVRLSKRH